VWIQPKVVILNLEHDGRNLSYLHTPLLYHSCLEQIIFGGEVFLEIRAAVLTYRDLYCIYFGGVVEFAEKWSEAGRREYLFQGLIATNAYFENKVA